ncbi:hypothetical protein HD554DRAFT_2171833 [Boletus coccyginus]|nr:hypothetical protein HD554DRAFT_2171833 [Boletus coccyginus]
MSTRPGPCESGGCTSPPPGSSTSAGPTTTVVVPISSLAALSSSESTSSPTDASAQSSTPAPTVDASSSTSTLAESSTAVATASSTSNAAVIAGSVIGGVVFLALVVLGMLFYLRARKRKRTPPSSEFINSIRDGAAPVLRLDSGAEYTSAFAEKGSGYTHYPPTPPPPFIQNSYYNSPQMLDTKFADETDVPSERLSIEKPLHPQRFSSPDSFVTRYRPTTSIGSRKELWGSDTEIFSGELSPVRQSPTRDSVLQFATRFSLDDLSPQPSHPSHSPPPLHPLRRQPDSEGT